MVYLCFLLCHWTVQIAAISYTHGTVICKWFVNYQVKNLWPWDNAACYDHEVCVWIRTLIALILPVKWSLTTSKTCIPLSLDECFVIWLLSAIRPWVHHSSFLIKLKLNSTQLNFRNRDRFHAFHAEGVRHFFRGVRLPLEDWCSHWVCHYRLYQLMPIGQQVHCHVTCISATTCLHLCFSI